LHGTRRGHHPGAALEAALHALAPRQGREKQVGKVEPTRDWFPISAVSTFSDFADLIHGPQAQWGTLSCGCHPNCGVGTAVLINRETKEWAPVPRFINVPGLMADLRKVTDAARNKIGRAHV